MLSIIRNKFTIIISLCALSIIFVLSVDPMFGMEPNAWKLLGMIIAMILLWCFEVVPLGVTALVPVVYAPMTGIETLGAVTALFGNPIIFLFLGGFLMGIAIENTGLHKRIALLVLSKVGNNPKHQLLAFMSVSFFVSMWISNTATVVMLLPVVLSVIKSLKHTKNDLFAKPLLIGVAYSASIGGASTLIGTPPNLLLKGFLENNSPDLMISFIDWMIFALPLCILLLLFAYLILLKHFHIMKDTNLNVNFDFKGDLQKLGNITYPEKVVGIIFILTAGCWILRPQINMLLGLKLTDEIIAIWGLLTLFFYPIDLVSKKFVVSTKDINKVPWDILLLFGGGLVIASLFVKTGLAVWSAQSLEYFSKIPTYAMIVLVSSLIQFLTELTSNTAISAIFLPLFSSFATEYNIHMYYVNIPLVLSASLAFMLPVGTPPNAIVFGSRYLKIMDLVKVGFFLNIVSILLVSLYSYIVIPIVFM